MTSSNQSSDGPGPADPAANATHNRRNEPRRRVLKSGTIAFNDRYSALPCTVRDLSAAGAHLRLEGTVNAPNTFELIVELDGLEGGCEVVWRKENDIGVRFLSAPRKLTPRRTQVVKALVPAPAPSLRKPTI